ncbi:MAG: hypothetical protein FWD57_10295 [Polyangiaceae bacterium]|nr:hypothetical protein [Polyangiaceae bacterium]
MRTVFPAFGGPTAMIRRIRIPAYVAMQSVTSESCSSVPNLVAAPVLPTMDGSSLSRCWVRSAPEWRLSTRAPYRMRKL